MEENMAKTVEGAERTDASNGGVDAAPVTSEGVPTPTEKETNDVEFSDGAQKAAEPKQTQTKEENREFARKRREAEREALIKETRQKAIIEVLGGKNPFTGDEMKDSLDVEEYLAMREIEREGGDPVADYAKFRKKRERIDAQRAQSERERADWYRRDREDFITAHPDVSLEELIADERFRSFAKGKVGDVPMKEIYADFVALTGHYEENARRMASQMLANKKASPGALSTSQSPESDYFTPEEVKKMSRDEVRANYEKIRNSMKKWN